MDSNNRSDRGFLEKASPLLGILLVVMAFALGSLWTKVKMLENGTGTPTTTTTTTTTGQGGTQQAAQQQQQQPAAAAVTMNTIKGLFSKDLIKFGDANKKVLFVEVADPSCPYCHAADGFNPELSKQMGAQFTLVADGGTYISPSQEMKKLVDQGKAGYTFIYMNGHGNGEMGMKAMYCAFENGKFWQVHALLMTNAGYNLMNTDVKNDKAKSSVVAQFLKSAMDAGTMQKCLDSGKYDARLSSDATLASSLGVTGTPGFYVNTQKYGGAYSFKEMQPVVDTALK